MCTSENRTTEIHKSQGPGVSVEIGFYANISWESRWSYKSISSNPFEVNKARESAKNELRL